MLKHLLLGAAAGAAATVPMTMTMEALHDVLPGEPDRPLPPREITDSLAAKAGVADELEEAELQRLTLGGHVGYGAACGAVLGLIAPRKTAAAVGVGMLFGFAVWVGSYKGWLPALHVRHDARYDPPARSALMIAAHVVWGAAAGLEIASARREEHA
jgi:putative membrane protein